MEKRRKFLAVVMSVFMLVTMLPSMAWAASVPSGELGGKLKIKGLAVVGTVLSADYSKVTPEGMTDDYVSFSWSRDTAGDGKELTQVGTDKTYTVAAEDLNCWLTLEIKGLEGSAVTGSLKVKSTQVTETEEEAQVLAQQQEEQEAQAGENGQGDSVQAQLEEADAAETDASESDPSQTESDEENTGSQDALQETEKSQNDSEMQADAQVPEEEQQENAGAGEDIIHIYTESELDQENASDSQQYQAEVNLNNEEFLDFGEVISDEESEMQAQYIEITNTGTQPLNFNTVSPEHFMAEDIEEPLAAGESVSLWVQPREGLEQGDYDDLIIYTTQEGVEVSFEAKVSVQTKDTEEIEDTQDTVLTETPEEEQVTETPDVDKDAAQEQEIPSEEADAELAASASIAADTEELSFENLKKGYEQTETQQVILVNSGEETVTVKVPQAEYFQITAQSQEEPVVLEAGETAAFDVQPKMNLETGDYRESLTFTTEETDEAVAEVTAEVQVEEPQPDPEPVISVLADPANIAYNALEEGYEVPDATRVTVTNTGNTKISLIQPEAEYFDLGELSATELEAGESASFSVTVKAGLAAGSYSEEIEIWQDAPDQEGPLATVNAAVNVAQKTIAKLSINPAALDFGSLEEGYAQAPQPQNITVTNEGNTTLNLSAPQAGSFTISDLTAYTLEPGESASFSVAPVTGLTEGTYAEMLTVSSEQQVSASADVKFVVSAKSIELTGIQKTADITGIKNGTEKSAEALGLPSQIVIETTNGTMQAAVQWNISGSSYDPSITTEQTFKVNGTVTLPDGVKNSAGINLITAVNVTVSAGRTARTADAANNKITGITTDGYTTQSKITFTAVGDGMDNESPAKNDTRYLPSSWTVINTNSWNAAPYTATFGITKAGTYTLKVVFEHQQFDGSNWVNTGNQDTKQVSFNIAQGETITATPTPQTQNGNQKNAVKTGDNTMIAPFIIILIIAAGCIVGVVIYRRKRK